MKRLNTVLSVVGGGFVFVMVLLISANAVVRKFGFPLYGAIAFAGFMLAAVIFLGLSHCEEVDGNVRVEFFLLHLPPKIKRLVLGFDYLAAILMFGALTWATGIDALHAWQIRQVTIDIIALPTYPVKFIVALGCMFMLIQLLFSAVRPSSQGGLEVRTEIDGKGFV